MQVDNLEQITGYLLKDRNIRYQSAMYLALKDTVEQGFPHASNALRRGIVLQLAACLGEIPLRNPYHFSTDACDEFEIGRKEAKQIYTSFLEDGMNLPAPGEIEEALNDLRDKYRQLEGWVDDC